MVVLFHCQHCGQGFRGTEAMIGKRTKCPACGQITRLVAEPEASSPRAAPAAPAKSTEKPAAPPRPPVAAPSVPAVPKRAEPVPTEPAAPVRAKLMGDDDQPRGKAKPARLQGDDEHDAPRSPRNRKKGKDEPDDRRDSGKKADSTDVKPKSHILKRILVFLLALSGTACCLTLALILHWESTLVSDPMVAPLFSDAAIKRFLSDEDQNAARTVGLRDLKSKKEYLDRLFPVMLACAGIGFLGGILALIRYGVVAGLTLLAAFVVPVVYDPLSGLLTVFFLMGSVLAFFIRTHKSALKAAQKRADAGKPPASGTVGYVFAVLFILSVLGYSIVPALTLFGYLVRPGVIQNLINKAKENQRNPSGIKPGGGTSDTSKEIGTEAIQTELDKVAAGVKLVPLELKSQVYHFTMQAPEGSQAQQYAGLKILVAHPTRKFRMLIGPGEPNDLSSPMAGPFRDTIVNNKDLVFGFTSVSKRFDFRLHKLLVIHDVSVVSVHDSPTMNNLSREDALLMIRCAQTLALASPVPEDPLTAIKPILDSVSTAERLKFNDYATNPALKLVQKIPTVRAVDISRSPITLDGVKNLQGANQIEELILGSRNATTANIVEVAKMTNLKKLTLSIVGSKFEADAFKPLAANTKMESLAFSVSDFFIPPAVLPSLAAIPNLKNLTLRGSSQGDNLIPLLKSIGRLESLDLSDCKLIGSNLGELPATNLRELKLSENPFSDNGAAALAKFTQLEKLNLSKTQITDKTLAVLKNLKKLKSLDLSETKVTEAGVKQLEVLDELTELNLAGSPAQNYRRPKKVQPALPLDKLPPADPMAMIQRLKPEIKHQDGDESKPIVGLNFTDGKLTDLDLAHLRTLKGLKELDLAENEDITDAGLSYIAGMTDLEFLDLSDTEITGAGLASLKGMKKLKQLVLPYKPFTVKELAPLAQLTELESCSIDLNTETVEKLQILSNFPKLKAINLPYRPLPREAYTALGKMTNLESLILMSDDKQKVTDVELASLKGLTKLRNLSLPRAEITAAGLENLKGCTTLSSLNLAAAKLNDDALKAVGALPSLTSLLLSNTPVTDAGLVHLAPLTKLNNLNLIGTKITGSGLVHLKGATGLQALMLNDSPLTDAGLPALEPLKGLTSLGLRNTQITGKGLSVLKGHSKLFNLDVSGTQLNDAGLKEVGELTQLTYLPLSKTKITDAGVPSLAKLTKLTVLSLEDTALTGAGFRTLASLDKVTLVNLSGTKFNSGGLDNLAALPNLTNLILNGTAIDDAIIPRLKQFPKLQSLSLQKTAITTKSFVTATNIKTLQFLDVTGTKVSKAAVQKIRQTRPMLSVRFD
jgi:Leucine-rich repeat (LRR) protein